MNAAIWNGDGFDCCVVCLLFVLWKLNEILLC
jgi:hypothetical protein